MAGFLGYVSMQNIDWRFILPAAMSAEQILASSLLMGVFLLIVELTGAIDIIRKFTPNSVIRGVQLSTGALLIAGGVKFMIGTSKYQSLQQAVEPHLSIQSIGAVPISLVIGAIAAIVTLLLLDNKKFPAGLIVAQLLKWVINELPHILRERCSRCCR